MQEKDFITAVLVNTTTALLVFIRPEIDDILPKLLGYDITAIEENPLIKEAKIEYNKIAKLSQVGVSKDISQNDVMNNAERGQDTYTVKNDSVGVEVDPSNYITEDCLLRRCGMEIHRIWCWEDDKTQS